MDELPESLLLQILSRLNDSADVARCRVAYKAFNTVFPDLRSINLRCSTVSSCLKSVFVDIISKLRVVESVCVDVDNHVDFDPTDGDFVKEWLPRVSLSLKSLSLSALLFRTHQRPSNVLLLISAFCHNLVSLTLTSTWLSVDNLNQMPMLTTLAIEYTRLHDQHLNELNKWFPNLQALKLLHVKGLRDPKIHHINIQTCHWDTYKFLSSLTLITPNLITLKLQGLLPDTIHVEAPMLSHFHLSIPSPGLAGPFTAKKFECLKTLWLDASRIGFILSEFPTTETVQDLTLDSWNKASRDSNLTLGKVFMVFPNLTSLCIMSTAWSELEASMSSEGWEILDGRKGGVKTICAYLMLVDPSLTFSCVACVLDQCVGLSEVSLLIHGDVDGTKSKSFMSKCMARWHGLKWRWGTWR